MIGPHFLRLFNNRICIETVNKLFKYVILISENVYLSRTFRKQKEIFIISFIYCNYLFAIKLMFSIVFFFCYSYVFLKFLLACILMDLIL